MTTDSFEAVLARLDERSGHIVKELEELNVGQRALWKETNELKGETLKTRGEVADVKRSMIDLEERERERNGQIRRITEDNLKRDTDMAALASRVSDLEGDYISRIGDAETNITALLTARHDQELRDETVSEADTRMKKERAAFRERWHFTFEIIGFLALLLGSGIGVLTIAHTLGLFGG